MIKSYHFCLSFTWRDSLTRFVFYIKPPPRSLDSPEKIIMQMLCTGFRSKWIQIFKTWNLISSSKKNHTPGLFWVTRQKKVKISLDCPFKTSLSKTASWVLGCPTLGGGYSEGGPHHHTHPVSTEQRKIDRYTPWNNGWYRTEQRRIDSWSPQKQPFTCTYRVTENRP